MSWFSKPVEYRRYDDGTVEIIERRSFLRIGAAVLVGLGLVSAGAYTFRTPPEMGPGSSGGNDRSLYLTQQAMVRIVDEADVEAVYRILPHYAQLTAGERFLFWSAVASLHIDELKAFAGMARLRENDTRVRTIISMFLRAAEQRGR